MLGLSPSNRCPASSFRHQNSSVQKRSHQIFGNSMSRNVAQWPNVEERHPVFNVGKARYTAIPVKADLPDLKIHGADRLVTVLSAQAADLEDVNWLQIVRGPSGIWEKTFGPVISLTGLSSTRTHLRHRHWWQNKQVGPPGIASSPAWTSRSV